MTSALRERRARVATAVGLLVGSLAYVLALFDYQFDPTRTAVRLGFASNFFDIQARAFLDGRIDVPAGSLGIEGFVVDGRTYMYFPPFPALLRIPVMLVTSSFDGRMSLASMGLAFVVMATMTTLLVWTVRDCLVGARPVGRFEAATAGVFLAGATGGTILTFDAALPWVYHEVYVWAAALVIGAIYWMIRFVVEPSRRNAAWLLGFTLAAALTRTTGGWALSIVSLGIALWFATGRAGDERRAVWPRAAVTGAAPLAAAVAYNAAKFGHPYLFPLEDQVWTGVNAHRREALAVNGGTITGPQFFLTSLVNYFRPDGIRFVDYFPFITLPAQPARAYGGAFLDQYYRTGSVTAFMPLLLLLSLVAVPVLLRRTADIRRRALRPAVLAGVLVTGGVMAYGYVAHRYTSEFVPALVTAGAVGLWGVCSALTRARRSTRVGFLVASAVLCCFAIAANMLTAHTAVALVSRGESLRDYVEAQVWFARTLPTDLPALVTQSDGLPSTGVTDELHMVGDCDALYLNTGDAYEPWVLVEQRAQVLSVEVGPLLREARTLLYTVTGTTTRKIYLDSTDDDYARVVIADEKRKEYAGPWFPVYPKGSFRVGVQVSTDLGYAEVTTTPGGFVGYVPFIEWDADWNARPGSIKPAASRPVRHEWQGVTVRPVPGLPLTACRHVLDIDR